VGLFLFNRESYRLNKLDTQFTVLDRNMYTNGSKKVFQEMDDLLQKVRDFKPRNEKQVAQKKRIEDSMYMACVQKSILVGNTRKQVDPFQ
jgi:hypothetical protein